MSERAKRGPDSMAPRRDRGGGHPWPLHVLQPPSRSPTAFYTSPPPSPLLRFCTAPVSSPGGGGGGRRRSGREGRCEFVRHVADTFVVRPITLLRAPAKWERKLI
uniref:Uncharacterized protein n=1 Tax=Arundo donax TaxID=35708 RepID=A0A0A9DN66_ARUDO